MTERLHFHFSLSCIGEGNGNPLQCSCLENSRDGGACWAAVYRVAQSRTWLKWLSSSSSSILYWCFTFWLTSLCIIGSSFIHLIWTDSNVFFLKPIQYCKVKKLKKKSRDISFLTKVGLVIYGCESWTIKKADHQRTDVFELWCWRRLLRVPWTAKRSNQSILKEVNPEYH